MNILFISPNSPFNSVGGIERYITNLIRYYENRTDCHVYIVVPTLEKSEVRQIGQVTVYLENAFSMPRKVRHRHLEISKRARSFARRITRIVRDHKIDVICAENFMFGLPAIYSLQLNMIATMHKLPLVLRLHSFATTPLQSELISQLMWNRVSCVSQSVAGDCFQKGCEIDTLSTDYLGVDVSEFTSTVPPGEVSLKEELGLPKNTRFVMTATRIVHGKSMILEKKGVINLIRAFSKICNRFPELRLLIAVGIPTETVRPEFDAAHEMLMGYIKLHGIEKQTIVKTFALADMPRVYRSSDVFVLASENETFGQVFIEAMSCGTPVVGTKVGGIPEIISDTYNGYLVQPNDASILAQRIERLLNDQEIRESFIKAATSTVQNMFTAQKQFSAFHEKLQSHVQSERT